MASGDEINKLRALAEKLEREQKAIQEKRRQVNARLAWLEQSGSQPAPPPEVNF